MANALKAKELTSHQAVLAKETGKRSAVLQAKGLKQPLQEKKFGDLTGLEKDELLKVIALELGMIAPD